MLGVQDPNNQIADLVCKVRRNGVSHLPILVGRCTLKEVVVREGLEACCLPDAKTPTLRGIGVDILVPVLTDVRSDCGRWSVAELHPEAVGKGCLGSISLNVAVIRSQIVRSV